MMVFVDTSAIYAAVDARDARHEAVAGAWRNLRRADARFTTTNYVAVEAFALVQKRAGVTEARRFAEDILPLLGLAWVDEETHQAGIEAVLAANRRDLSLVDCVSFVVMRRLGIRQALTVDPHFREQGFECLPKESEQPA